MNVKVDGSLLRFETTADRDKALVVLMLYPNYADNLPAFGVQLGNGGTLIAFPHSDKIQNAARLLAVEAPAMPQA